MVDVAVDEDLIELVNSNKLSFDRALAIQVLRELKKKEESSPPPIPESIKLVPS